MIQADPRVQAIVVVNPQGPGGAERFATPFGSSTVLGHTIQRLGRCQRIGGICLVHPPGFSLPEVPDGKGSDGRPVVHILDVLAVEAGTARRNAARKWAPTCWRGGLGGATCFDEVLFPAAALAALEVSGGSAGLLVGGDWPLVDPNLCDALVERHLRDPQHLPLVFTQAAPGWCGGLVSRELLSELQEKQAMIGSLLDYQPQVPQGDPIAKDPCVQVETAARRADVRAVFDAPRWRAGLEEVERALGAGSLMDVSAARLGAMWPQGVDRSRMPQQVTLEMTPRRMATGPLAAPARLALERGDMAVERARNLFDRLGAEPDVALTLGGLGDPLLHPQWMAVVSEARAAGIWGLCLETDLLVEADQLPLLLEADIDVLSIRLNADSAETYRQVMGCDRFAHVLANIQWLLNERARRRDDGLPWIVPRLAKTADNLHELPGFMDRWIHFCGHAVVESPAHGCGLVPDLSLVRMAPPQRTTCRQLGRRLSVLSDGTLAQCDQDWLGQAPLGTIHDDLAECWGRTGTLRHDHEEGNFRRSPLCAACDGWHRP